MASKSSLAALKRNNFSTASNCSEWLGLGERLANNLLVEQLKR
jgi:hypothetical protein